LNGALAYFVHFLRMASTIRHTDEVHRGGEEPSALQETAMLAALARGDTSAAHDIAMRLIEGFPERGVAWKVAGALRWAAGRTDEALAAMRTSVRLLPQDAEAHCNLGLTLTHLQQFEAAEPYFTRAVEIDPRFSIAHYRLGMSYFLQGRLAAAQASLRRGIACKTNYAHGDDAQNHSNLLFVSSHDPDVGAASLCDEHRRFGEEFEGRLAGSWPAHANERSPGRTLKVGFVSGDLHDHSVGRFLEPLLAELARRPHLQLHAYCTNPREDAISRRLRAHCPHWVAVETFLDIPLAEKIIEDQIDILIDLAGHTGHNRLPVFARKPAPVQVSWLGYPGTTGLTAIQYYLADPLWLPPGQFDWMFTEKLVYLPDRWAFEPYAAAPAVAPLPALTTGRLTFGSFHRLGKINPATVRLWSELLRAFPTSTLLMVGIRLHGQEKALLEQFAAHGIESARLELHDRCPMDRYLGFHNQVDIALDTLAYSGATTTMHSLSMGVPTLTIAGGTPQARACAGILAHVGLDRFIASDAADFLAKARHWAAHLDDLAALRSGLRTRLRQTPGANPALIADHIDQALRRMWQRWCGGLPAESFHTETPCALPPTGTLA
jgi:predicted O-linked N-acetylglucosamine transferase (SPINDLY family)